MLETILNLVTTTFKEKLTTKSEIFSTTQLSSQLASEFTALLKTALVATAQEVLKTFLLSFEEKSPFLEKQGKRYYRKMSSPKAFLTLFGEIHLPRLLYQAKDGESRIPLDEKWEMCGQFATQEVREMTAFSMALMTQEESTQLLNKVALFPISEKTVRKITEEVGTFMEKKHSKVMSFIREREEIPKEADIVVESLDGVNVRLREKGKKAGKAVFKPKDRKWINETKTAKKNCLVSAISLYKKGEPLKNGEKGLERPINLKTSYLGRMPEEGGEELKREFEEECLEIESKLKGDVKKIVLMDGQLALWNYVRGKEQFKEHEQILDFYHASEHLSTLAELLFGQEIEGKRWYEKWEEELKENKAGVEKMLKSVAYYQKMRRVGKTKAEKIENEIAYFEKNKKIMRYKEYLEKGWPIGSGPVEAACKTIVRTRMCRSGMQWIRLRGQNILHLRCLVKSNRWNLFWKAYSQPSLVA